MVFCLDPEWTVEMISLLPTHPYTLSGMNLTLAAVTDHLLGR